MIPAAEVFKLAHHVGVDARAIEKDYVLSWLLLAIADGDLRDVLVFKGGTALKRCYYPDYRFSEDLDFTLTLDMTHENLVTAVEALFPVLRRRVNLTMALGRAQLNIHGSSALLVNYAGPLGGRLDSRDLKVDATRGEVLLYGPVEKRLLAPYSDFPEDVTVKTYPLEEILTEKLVALIGRTEPRDLYDVRWLFESGDVDMSFLPVNFAAKCHHKDQDPTRLGKALTEKEDTFGRLWANRLSVQVVDLPDLNETLRVVRRHLRKLVLI